MTEERSAGFVQSLARGLSVIRAFDADAPRQTLSDVARRTGLSRAAARRFLLTLCELGYVHTDGSAFSLSPRVLELGYTYLSSLPLSDHAAPFMNRVVEQVQESCSVSVQDGDDIVYVARVPMQRVMSVQIHVGTRFPAYVTSMGRVFLAYSSPNWLADYLGRLEITAHTSHTVSDTDALIRELDLVREQGHAAVDQEMELGLCSIAVPVWDAQGRRVVAAMNVATHASRGDCASLRETALPALLEAAQQVGASLADSAGYGISVSTP